jgi:hypothetical protein
MFLAQYNTSVYMQIVKSEIHKEERREFILVMYTYLRIIEVMQEELIKKNLGKICGGMSSIIHSLFLTYLLTYAAEPLLRSGQLCSFPAFYGTRRFNTVFTRALHWSIS